MIGGIVVGNSHVPLMGKLLFAASVIIAILIWVISLAKTHSKNPIVFEDVRTLWIHGVGELILLMEKDICKYY